MNRILKTIENLLFVPKCAYCRERLNPIPDKYLLSGSGVFCKNCVEEWNMTLAQVCPACFQRAGRCFCSDSFIQKRQKNIPSLFFYENDKNNLSKRIIHSIKKRKSSSLFDLLALSLAMQIEEMLSKNEILPSDCIFTYIPRTRKSYLKFGFDQSKLLSERIAKHFNAVALPLFIKVFGREQKHLGQKERKENAQSSICLNFALFNFPRRYKVSRLEEAIGDKPIVIVDDIITSGASLGRGVELLEKIKAKSNANTDANTDENTAVKSKIFVSCVARASFDGTLLKNLDF